MSSATVPTIGAIALQLVLGIAVFQANPKRRLNQCFLLLSLAVVAWLCSLHFAFTATTPIVAEFSIREAAVAGALALMMFNLLRLSFLQGSKVGVIFWVVPRMVICTIAEPLLPDKLLFA